MKKLFAVPLTIAMILAMTACGGGSTPVSSGGAAPSSPEGAKQVTVGLIQLMEHPSLDEIRAAITARLTRESTTECWNDATKSGTKISSPVILA